ncbi:unnamed protein product [Amoebophrya sp. A25]|nr:unnamed protein product [Amoebophrya sp. A25]|eukprot:GSA25T00007034001.1
MPVPVLPLKEDLTKSSQQQDPERIARAACHAAAFNAVLSHQTRGHEQVTETAKTSTTKQRNYARHVCETTFTRLRQARSRAWHWSRQTGDTKRRAVARATIRGESYLKYKNRVSKPYPYPMFLSSSKQKASSAYNPDQQRLDLESLSSDGAINDQATTGMGDPVGGQAWVKARLARPLRMPMPSQSATLIINGLCINAYPTLKLIVRSENRSWKHALRYAPKDPSGLTFLEKDAWEVVRLGLAMWLQNEHILSTKEEDEEDREWQKEKYLASIENRGVDRDRDAKATHLETQEWNQLQELGVPTQLGSPAKLNHHASASSSTGGGDEKNRTPLLMRPLYSGVRVLRVIQGKYNPKHGCNFVPSPDQRRGARQSPDGVELALTLFFDNYHPATATQIATELFAPQNTYLASGSMRVISSQWETRYNTYDKTAPDGGEDAPFPDEQQQDEEEEGDWRTTSADTSSTTTGSSYSMMKDYVDKNSAHKSKHVPKSKSNTTSGTSLRAAQLSHQELLNALARRVRNEGYDSLVVEIPRPLRQYVRESRRMQQGKAGVFLAEPGPYITNCHVYASEQTRYSKRPSAGFVKIAIRESCTFQNGQYLLLRFRYPIADLPHVALAAGGLHRLLSVPPQTTHRPGTITTAASTITWTTLLYQFGAFLGSARELLPYLRDTELGFSFGESKIDWGLANAAKKKMLLTNSAETEASVVRKQEQRSSSRSSTTKRKPPAVPVVEKKQLMQPRVEFPRPFAKDERDLLLRGKTDTLAQTPFVKLHWLGRAVAEGASTYSLEVAGEGARTLSPERQKRIEEQETKLKKRARPLRPLAIFNRERRVHITRALRPTASSLNDGQQWLLPEKVKFHYGCDQALASNGFRLDVHHLMNKMVASSAGGVVIDVALGSGPGITTAFGGMTTASVVSKRLRASKKPDSTKINNRNPVVISTSTSSSTSHTVSSIVKHSKDPDINKIIRETNVYATFFAALSPFGDPAMAPWAKNSKEKTKTLYIDPKAAKPQPVWVNFRPVPRRGVKLMDGDIVDLVSPFNPTITDFPPYIFRFRVEYGLRAPICNALIDHPCLRSLPAVPKDEFVHHENRKLLPTNFSAKPSSSSASLRPTSSKKAAALGGLNPSIPFSGGASSSKDAAGANKSVRSEIPWLDLSTIFCDHNLHLLMPDKDTSSRSSSSSAMSSHSNATALFCSKSKSNDANFLSVGGVSAEDIQRVIDEERDKIYLKMKKQERRVVDQPRDEQGDDENLLDVENKRRKLESNEVEGSKSKTTSNNSNSSNSSSDESQSSTPSCMPELLLPPDEAALRIFNPKKAHTQSKAKALTQSKAKAPAPGFAHLPPSSSRGVGFFPPPAAEVFPAPLTTSNIMNAAASFPTSHSKQSGALLRPQLQGQARSTSLSSSTSVNLQSNVPLQPPPPPGAMPPPSLPPPRRRTPSNLQPTRAPNLTAHDLLFGSDENATQGS